MLANHVFWRLMLLYTHVLLLLQPSVIWLSIATFNNDAKPQPKLILREFDVFRIRPRLGGLPLLETLHGKIWPRLRGLPGLADRATRLGGSPHLSCKRDPSKMRDYMDRRVTSPTWGPPTPCKQALSVVNSSPITFFFFQSLQTYLRETAEDLTTDKVATVLIFFLVAMSVATATPQRWFCIIKRVKTRYLRSPILETFLTIFLTLQVSYHF